MPACMTTSIWPSAAMARTVARGRTYDHEVLCRAAGATNAAITTSARAASQTGKKRAAETALETNARPGAINRSTLPGRTTVMG
jgi:hypothetical protein